MPNENFYYNRINLKKALKKMGKGETCYFEEDEESEDMVSINMLYENCYEDAYKNEYELSEILDFRFYEKVFTGSDK